jgi:DNA polymerase I
MTMLGRLPFKHVWVVDFEYCQPDGSLPDPLCVVARDLISGNRVERWIEPDDPGLVPYDVGPESCLVAHNASAECLCHIVLGWPLPAYVIDTYAEFRAAKNGYDTDRKASLLVAASRYNIPTITSVAKDAGREIAIQGRAYAETQKDRLIRYCWTDVDTNADLIIAMLPEILMREQGLNHAIIRGEYMKALAAVDHEGVPIDHDLLARLQAHWQEIRLRLIGAKDTGRTDCYVDGRFNKKRFEALLESLGQLEGWPRTETGQVSTADEIFRRRGHAHPVLGGLYELHWTLEKLKTLTLHVGSDGRHRAKGLFPFGTKTGRNAPSGFIFAPAVWVRHLIRPEPGMCVVYSDYSAQEVHISARKSQDPKMIEAIESGDPYMWHAKATGLAPPTADKKSHAAIRNDIYKPFLLSQYYGSTAKGISERLGVAYDYAQHALASPHGYLYRTYWKWSQNSLYSAIEKGLIRTRFGWQMHITGQTTRNTMLNWPIQAAGADVLRLAIISLVRNGIRVAAPVHDAVLTVCHEDEIEKHTTTVKRIMENAARVGIGWPIPVDCKVVKWPYRYADSRGTEMFQTIVELLEDIERRTIEPKGENPHHTAEIPRTCSCGLQLGETPPCA